MDALLSTILSPILRIIDKAVPDKTEANRLQNEITQALIEQKGELMKTMRDITMKELEGTGYQRNWRPTLSWMVIGMWPYNYVFRPMFIQMFGVDLVEIPPASLDQITLMWSTVYGLGRTVEKSAPGIVKDMSKK